MSAVEVAEAAKKLNPRHPLQRLDSPSKGFSGVLHFAGLLSFYSSFKFLVDNPSAINESFGWHFQYITVIGLTISSFCFTFGLLADVTNSNTCFMLKNYLALVAAPIEILVSILYWGLRAIDTALVVPPGFPLPPFIADLGFHLIPSIVLTLDTLLLSPPWPTSPINPQAPLLTLANSTALAFAYWFWIDLCFYHNGFYPYPIFGLLGTWQRVGLFALSGVVMWIMGAGLRIVYAFMNGMEIVPETKAADNEPKIGVIGKSGKFE